MQWLALAIICAIIISLIMFLWPKHEQRHTERFGGLYPDTLGGPRVYHEIWWECDCGDVRGFRAKRRAERAIQQGAPA